MANRSETTPRWVIGFAIVALVIVVLIAVLLVTGRGGDHGPSRHAGRIASHTAVLRA